MSQVVLEFLFKKYRALAVFQCVRDKIYKSSIISLPGALIDLIMAFLNSLDFINLYSGVGIIYFNLNCKRHPFCFD